MTRADRVAQMQRMLAHAQKTVARQERAQSELDRGTRGFFECLQRADIQTSMRTRARK